MKFVLAIIGFFLIGTNILAQVSETVYIHTDKAVYHAGEIIWMRADVVDGSSAQPLPVSKVVYAELLNTNNKPVLQAKIGISPNAVGQGTFNIPLNIASGSYVLRAYTNWMKNFSPEYYFHKVITIYNINDTAEVISSLNIKPSLDQSISVKDLTLSVKSDKNEYETRNKIVLDISSSTEASVSISVYKIDSMQYVDQTNIKDRLSRSFASLPQDKPVFEYLPEYYGHIITGKIIETQTQKPAAGIKGYLSVAGSPHFFKQGVSDQYGNISFHMKDFYGVDELACQTNFFTDSNYTIRLNNSFSENYALFDNADSIKLSSFSSADRLQYGVGAQVQYAYHSSNQDKYIFPTVDTISFFGNPDGKYNVSEYTKFTSMEDVLREYVTEVGVQVRSGKLYPFIYDRLRRKPFVDHPLFLVNGMPVFDVNKIMLLDPNLLSAIEVIDWKYFLNGASSEGVVSILTKNRNQYDFEMENNALLIDYSGLLPGRIFYIPGYENKEVNMERLPDYRNVLYWTPDHLLKKGAANQIEFYSSDIKGEYAVVIQGISKTGEVGSNVSFLTVK